MSLELGIHIRNFKKSENIMSIIDELYKNRDHLLTQLVDY